MSRVFALMLGLACSLPAQGGPDALRMDCRDNLPEDAFTRVTVYLEADAADSGTKRWLPVVDAFTESLASRIRTSLGAGENELPAGESVVHWRRMDGDVLVTARRDGGLSWSLSGAPSIGETRAAIPLLARTIAAMQAADERVWWPDDTLSDSLTFYLGFRRPVVDADSKIEPMETRHAVAAFSLGVPWEKPVGIRTGPEVRYPRNSEFESAIGNLILQFVVDTLGRADMSTVKDVWPSSSPPLTGKLGRHYRQFVAAATRGLRSASFNPALVGGCVVRQLIVMPFTFNIR